MQIDSFNNYNSGTILFIDSSISDHENLQLGVIEGVETIILSGHKDGIQEITQVLQQRPQISTIHIVSHGSPGCLYLGNTQLNLHNFSQYAELLKCWKSHNILLYGCNVGAGDAGAEFIAKFHEITNANITASATKTGNAVLGGDWNLEVSFPEHHGTSLVFQQETLATYQGVFAVTLAGTYDTSGNARGLQIVGNYAYIADEASGLQIIDISNPNNPILKATYDTPGFAIDVQIVGNYAYLTDDASGLKILDISDPTNPVLKGSYDTAGQAFNVQIVGNYAYVSDFSQGLSIIDISNPNNPTLKGTYDTPGNTRGIQVVGNYAYLADESSGLQIIDISNPSNPVLIATYDTPGLANNLRIVGNYAYLTDETSGLSIIDISNPINPILKGTYDTSGIAIGIEIVGNYAYIADYNQGLSIIDISDPNNPILKGTYDTPGLAIDVQVVGNYAYLTDFDGGFNIINVREFNMSNNQVLQGTDGDDLFIGTDGNDTIIGGAGVDTVDYSHLATKITLKAQGIVDKGALGTDTVQAEVFISNSHFANVIDASSSSTNAINVNLSANSLTVFGLPSGDTTFNVINFTDVKGSQLADEIIGNEQNNRLEGQGGDDLIFASTGNDTIIGGDGVDTVDYNYLDSAITLEAQGIVTKATGGTDTVQAERIVGNAAYRNKIDASSSTINPINADLSLNSLTVFGLPSGDVTFDVVNFQDVTGTQADDIITGNELDNILEGQAGNDLFFATVGNDTITGGTGSDTVDYSNLGAAITVKPTGFIEKDGGLLGVDKVSAEEIIGNADYINVIDASSSTTASLDVDLFNNSLKVLGTSVGDLAFEVQNFSNVIGSQVADIIKGNSGNNNLRGEGGNDTLTGGAGSDTLNGGTGTDTASYLTSNSAVTVNLTTGIASGGDATGDSFISIENATGSAFNDNLTGNNLNNILNGGAGNDNLNGGAGNDSVFGDIGNDVLTGGLGSDTLDGGAGIDTASYATATAAVAVNLATGNGSLGEANGDHLIAIENVTGSNYNDILTGNTANNTLTGNNGNDTLNGDAGNDILLGGSGNDVLIGGLGNDTLTGGVGVDIFRFNSINQGIDRITDFSVIDDTIAVLGSGFGGLTVGTLSTSAFVIGSAATNFSQRFIYNNTNGGLFFDRDGIGTSFSSVQLGTLNSGLSLTNADFQIV
jgi:hypothetical protein